MLPPRLAYILQNLITRKLLESSTFHQFVSKTDGAFNSIRLGLKEGWQEAEQEISNRRKNLDQNNSTSSRSDDSTSSRSGHPTSRSTGPTNNRWNTSSSDRTQQEPPKSRNRDQERLKTEQKLQELLEKLRRQTPKSWKRSSDQLNSFHLAWFPTSSEHYVMSPSSSYLKTRIFSSSQACGTNFNTWWKELELGSRSLLYRIKILKIFKPRTDHPPAAWVYHTEPILYIIDVNCSASPDFSAWPFFIW